MTPPGLVGIPSMPGRALRWGEGSRGQGAESGGKGSGLGVQGSGSRAEGSGEGKESRERREESRERREESRERGMGARAWGSRSREQGRGIRGTGGLPSAWGQLKAWGDVDRVQGKGLRKKGEERREQRAERREQGAERREQREGDGGQGLGLKVQGSGQRAQGRGRRAGSGEQRAGSGGGGKAGEGDLRRFGPGYLPACAGRPSRSPALPAGGCPTRTCRGRGKVVSWRWAVEERPGRSVTNFGPGSGCSWSGWPRLRTGFCGNREEAGRGRWAGRPGRNAVGRLARGGMAAGGGGLWEKRRMG